MNTQDPQSIIALLFRAARVDGELADQEIRFIFDVGKRLGLPSGTIEQLQYQAEKYTLTIPKNEEERMVILYQLLFMLKIDNVIRDEEQKLYHAVALRLGIRPALSAALLAVASRHLTTPIPISEMLPLIKQYMN